jgi:very-short-patch-repair endonuclease
MSNGNGAGASPPKGETGANDGAASGTSRTILAIDELRRRLLDLSLNNQLLNFRPSEKSRRHIRIVDEVPSVLIEKLQDGKHLVFSPVEMPDIEPEDETTPEFQDALKSARAEDEEYKRAKSDLGPRPKRKAINALERELRDRLREKLGMEPWKPVRDVKKQAELLGISTSYDLAEKVDGAKRGHTDDRLQVLFFPDEMDAKLSAIHSTAASLEKDAGIQGLYVAFGFLEWYEARDSMVRLYAPLLLWPVGMSKDLVDQRYEYAVTGRDEDEAVNHSLIEKLRNDFSLVLPDIENYEDEDGENLDLPGWLKAVDQAVKSVDPRWRVCNWVTVGLMTFHKIAMWEDLDAENWPKSVDPRKNTLLDKIFGDGEAWDGEPAAQHDIDKEEAAGNGPLLITDADSSQHSAVIDVMKGENLVIQGPPGTGKSQTITNIISAAMNEGKSVLFISDKMAALEVVKSRMDAAGLGDFCLELHSDKASRTAVLAALKSRMEMTLPSYQTANINALRINIEKRKQDLTSYVEKMNAPAGNTGRTVHDVIWGHARTKETLSQGPKGLRDVRLPDPLEIGSFDLAELKRIAQSLDDAAIALGEEARPSAQPWRGLGRTDLAVFHGEEIADRTAKAARSARDAAAAITLATKLAEWPEAPANRFELEEKLDAFLASGAGVPSAAVTPALIGLMDESPREAVRALRKHLMQRTRGLMGLAQLGDVAKLLVTGVGTLQAEAAVAARHKLEAMAEAELEAEAKKYEVVVGKADAAISALKKLAALLGTEVILTPVGAQMLMQALAHEFPSADALAVRNPALAREGSAASIEQAKVHADLMAKAKAEIGESAETDQIPSAGELRTALDVVLETGFFGRLGSALWPAETGYKSARKLARKILPGKGKLKGEALVSTLRGAAEWRKCASDFESYVASSPLVGDVVSTPAAPFAALIEAARWMEAVRRATPVTADGSAEIRKAVLDADEDRREALSAFAAAHGKTIGALTAQKIDSLDSAAQWFHQRLDAASGLLERLRAIGWSSSAAVGSLKEAAQLVAHIAAAEQGIAAAEVAQFALGSLWRGTETDVDLIEEAVLAAEGMEAWPIARSARRRIASSADPVAASTELHGAFRAAADAADAAVIAMAGLAQILQLSWPSWCGASDELEAGFNVFAERCERAVARIDLLPRQCTLVSLENAARDSGLGAIVDAWINDDLAFSGLADVLEAVWLRSAAEVIVRGDPTLSNHAGHAHEGVRRSFQKLDTEWLDLNRKELRAKLARKPVPPGSRSGPRRDWRERELLAHQCSLDRPSMHLRRLFALAGEAIRALKPCIMMSPMSVARYLQPSRNKFDIVVIDEASQMRPEDAAGALLRGHQVVICGDPQQLPPSNFFQAQGGTDSFDEDQEVVENSILELAMRAWKPVRTLNWHYRSRHQSLIAYSNARFYDGRLVVFPSDRDRGPTAGVHLEQVNGIYGNRRNEGEAKAIVAAAAKFMAAHPTKSLGIVAMNQNQQELISQLMDQLYQQDPVAEGYRRHWSNKLEHVFVKNLENVQGDERDAVFVSTVFGKDENGAFNMYLGPINLVHGHRRLNVLFTRAKEMMTVFTSMDPAEMKIAPGSNEGPKVLKEYLEYARTGFVPVSPEEDEERGPDSEFECWFLERLRQRGYDAVPQVGVRGYRIDIGVRHPDLPGRFILGVECDGATYHSAKATRDRDRLRQTVLERLGWQIHRVWSTDWFRDPHAEFETLLRRIDSLRGVGRSQVAE